MDKFPLYYSKYRAKVLKFSRSKHATFGIPFLIFVVGGSFALKEFAKVRYEFTHVNPYELPAESRVGKVVNIDPQEEYKKMMSKIDIDNWENKRIPRPWEEDPKSSS